MDSKVVTASDNDEPKPLDGHSKSEPEGKSAWDSVAEKVGDASAGKPQWLRLTENGDTATVVFRGEPHAIEVVFANGRYVRCDAAMKAGLKAEGKKPNVRVGFNIVDMATSDVKVFEVAGYFFTNLLQFRAKHPFDQWSFRIKRKGGAGDTKTFYAIEPDRLLTAEEQTEFDALPLFNLVTVYADTEGAPRPTSHAAADDSIASVQAIVRALQDLPFAATAQFCQILGIRKLVNLKARRFETGRRGA